MKFVKPSGVEVEVNESSIEAAEALGWKKAEKRKRRTKEEMAAAKEAE